VRRVLTTGADLLRSEKDSARISTQKPTWTRGSMLPIDGGMVIRLRRTYTCTRFQ